MYILYESLLKASICLKLRYMELTLMSKMNSLVTIKVLIDEYAIVRDLEDLLQLDAPVSGYEHRIIQFKTGEILKETDNLWNTIQKAGDVITL